MRPPGLFRSFVMAGFEGSAHRRPDGTQLDMLAATRHDVQAATDYALLRQCGIRTARDALRWHLIERTPGEYDWSSALPMIRAAQDAGLQVIWDLCHYGIPSHLDIWAPAFPDRFARFAAAAVRLLREEGTEQVFVCPVNEISFWAWAGGDHRGMYPSAHGRGSELKRQLVRAAVAATHAIRAAVPGTRFVMAEPLIHVAPLPGASARAVRSAENHRASQFEAFDMVAGRLHPELGGSEDCLDLLGVNFYPDNQFFRDGGTIWMGHWLYQPLRDLLAEVSTRYRRPMLITETGAEGRGGAGWWCYVMGEVRAALAAGVTLQGVCLYPVMDYPGWTNGRHCRCGLITVDAAWGARTVDAAVLQQLQADARTMDRGAACGAEQV